MKDIIRTIWVIVQKAMVELFPFGLALLLAIVVYYSFFSFAEKTLAHEKALADSAAVSSKDSVAISSADSSVASKNTYSSSDTTIASTPSKVIATDTYQVKDLDSKKSSWVYYVLLFAAVLVTAALLTGGYILYRSYNRVPEPQDPAELIKLLERKGKELKVLGTPRKIKRFINKVRLQYYLFSDKTDDLPANNGKKLINFSVDKNANNLFDILLEIEMDKANLFDMESFKTSVSHKEADDLLLEYIFEFNKDMRSFNQIISPK